MDMSEDFNDEASSDVVLHLQTTGAAAAQPSVREKRPRVDEGDAAPSRSFFMHRIVLRTSPYFKALMLRWNEPHAVAGGRMELTEHVEEGELEAADMVLRCMYKTGELPQQAHGSGELLLKMHRLADKYELPSRCMASIIGGLSALTPDKVDLRLLSAVYALPPALQGSEALRQLLATCQLAVKRLFAFGGKFSPELRRAVVRIFGNVPAVITSEELKAAFCCLPYGAVLAWLKVSVIIDDRTLLTLHAVGQPSSPL